MTDKQIKEYKKNCYSDFDEGFFYNTWKIEKPKPEQIRLKIKAKKDIKSKKIYIFGKLIAKSFSNRSAKVVVSGSKKIAAGGSIKYHWCKIPKDFEIELKVNKYLYNSNKNRVKNWEIWEIKEEKK